MQDLLRKLFDVAVAAVSPGRCIGRFLPSGAPANTLVVGAGKAAASMAAALADQYSGNLTGAVVTCYGHGLKSAQPIAGIEVLEAGHPVPDEASLRAGRKMIDVAHAAGPGDRVIVLISGGASALLENPVAGLSLEDLQIVNRELLASGAAIAEINCVRKKLSAIKGGGLAVAAGPAEILVLAISDVPGDRFDDIGSGPCSADDTTRSDACEVLNRYSISATPAVWSVLTRDEEVSTHSEDIAFDRIQKKMLARSQDALDAVADEVARAGFQPVLLGSDINLPAGDLARRQASLAKEYYRRGGRFALISGGETTVKVVNPKGRGGRNTEYLLHLAIELDGAPGIFAMAADTDGIDGAGDHAGAWIGPDALPTAAHLGLDVRRALARNESYEIFSGLSSLIVSGPTLTNVNDLRVILIDSTIVRKS
jgi:glycerate 2-kinase